jgi:hypothetical protein
MVLKKGERQSEAQGRAQLGHIVQGRSDVGKSRTDQTVFHPRTPSLPMTERITLMPSRSPSSAMVYCQERSKVQRKMYK